MVEWMNKPCHNSTIGTWQEAEEPISAIGEKFGWVSKAVLNKRRGQCVRFQSFEFWKQAIVVTLAGRMTGLQEGSGCRGGSRSWFWCGSHKHVHIVKINWALRSGNVCFAMHSIPTVDTWNMKCKISHKEYALEVCWMGETNFNLYCKLYSI